jgi:hypothetical protein
VFGEKVSSLVKQLTAEGELNDYLKQTEDLLKASGKLFTGIIESCLQALQKERKKSAD